MVCYAILCYGMENMLYHEISMLCYEISIQWYAMDYVVKDKHSVTVEIYIEMMHISSVSY